MAGAGDPASWINDNSLMREYLLNYLETLEGFPKFERRIIRLGTRLNKSKTVDVCRVPYDKTEQWFDVAHVESDGEDRWQLSCILKQ